MKKEDLSKWVETTNLAEKHIDEETLIDMGQKVVDWFDDDEESRKEWKERNDQWMKLATQLVEKKTYPWPDAANIKFPLLTTAAMQFAARAYPALVPGPNLVQGLVIGRDEGGKKQEQALRIGRHMSYQLAFDMENWEEDMDRLCLILPIVGVLFKKTYFDEHCQKNRSDLIMPDDLVVDYYAKSIEEATRKSHVLYRTPNQVQERINKGIFLDVRLPEPQDNTDRKTKDQIDGMKAPKLTPATTHKFIECHTYWDTDKDGYSEPYVITVHYETRKVVRVVARFRAEDIEEDDKGKITSIKSIEYFTKFGFIPNPDGSIYDLGFGILLGGINEVVNTLTNQLIDSGTLNNLQAGFLGRGIRIRAGSSAFQPGEWKPVDFTGDDIKKHIFPLPTKEPSVVLFQLLEALISSGKELASVAEIFVGKMPGQNTPATTTMATIEQGLKVFTAIYKRIYRALGKEYKKLFALNAIHLDEKVYFTINETQGPSGQEVNKTDYSPESISVKPFADPNIVSQAQKLMKIQAMGPLLELQTINPKEYTKRFLEAIDAENIGPLMEVQPRPDPEMMKLQMEGQLKQQDSQLKAQEMQQKMAMEEKMAQMEMQMKAMELKFKEMELNLKARESQMNMMIAEREGQQQMTLNQQTHNQKMQQGEQQHSLKMKQQKESAASAAKPTKSNNQG